MTEREEITCLPLRDVATKTTKICYRVEWDSPAGSGWWPSEQWAWSLSKSLYEHTALCDTQRGAQQVYREAVGSGGTNVRVQRWAVITVTTKAEDFDIEQVRP